ncbi:MAG: AAA domain-containing protein, partial [Janthinobacterium lividum]
PARWPGAGRHPLVLLQQAAINLSTKLNNDGILAINGPPGTGKTTLLRDIIANLVAKRAEMLVKFDDPLKAFVDSERRVKLEQGSRTIYNLDKSIKGFEILIVSSNNKAVENISVELPNIKAIACDADDLRYFNTLSDQLIGHETWGLISAVLGNNTNRSNFQKKFWSDNDFGLFTYLKEAAGSPQIFNIKDQDGKIIGSRKPKIIENHNPPLNHIEALKRWQCAREDFLAKLSLSQDKLAKLQEIKEVVQHLSSLKSNFKSHNFEETLVEHKKFKPNFISRILKTISACDWQKQFEELLHCIDVKNKVDIFSADLDSHFIDSNLFLKAHKEIHLVSPWCDAETQRLRDEVFISAIKLHKAFIDAAAKPLLDNIGILMRNLCRQVDFLNIEVSYTNIGSTDILSSLPDLWSSLFLIVPSVSSAFASIESMIGYLPKESLGWLLIDEAGQALPQAAVGAIMRARNIIITGDPLQIAPVVTLPDTLTKSICREFEVDPNLYNAPFASVQTLADSASKYFSEFHTNYGNRTVGFPLLVHRRCAEPMFSISNAIAYENLMVQAKSFVDSPIRNCLGPSNWFNIKGKPIDKWCPEEGEFVLALLRKLRAEEVYPDLYIIAPFKIIVNNLRSMIKRSNIMDSWPGVPTDWTKERIGTTHTVQGREAEAVIFVLGATARDQHGSRTWAGYSPNLVNVAVTRAKEATYIVGNRDLWKEAGVFRELYNRINTN